MNWLRARGWFRLSILAAIAWLVLAPIYIEFCETDMTIDGTSFSKKCYSRESTDDMRRSSVLWFGGAIAFFIGLNAMPWVLRGFKKD